MQALWSIWRSEFSIPSVAARLLLLTGCRSREIRSLRWASVQADSFVALDTKAGGSTHRVHMSRQVSALFEHLRIRTGTGPYCFPSTGRGGYLAGLHFQVKAWTAAAGIDHWTPHDLRRTFGTILAEQRVPLQVRRVTLNHGPKNLTDRTYNAHQYQDEAKEAWQLAADVVEDACGPAV